MNERLIEVQNGVSTTIDSSIAEHAKVSVCEIGQAMEPPEAALNGKDELIKIDDQPIKAPESALEQLAKQPEVIANFKDMTSDVKEMDMIAFKVFTPNFEQSDYIIGLVETIIGRNTSDQQDYDLVLQIMGRH